MDFEEVVNIRKSVRKFTNKKPDWRDIIECIDSMRSAPMAGGSFSLKIILVNNKKTMQKLAEAAQQDFVAEAEYIVVVCSDKKRITNLFNERAEMYSRQQAGAAIENFLLALTNRGLASCWIGHFVEEQVKRELKIPEHIQVEAIFPVGYESQVKGEKRYQKNKVNLNSILYFEKYGPKYMKAKIPSEINV